MRFFTGLGRESNCELTFENEGEGWTLEIEQGTEESGYIFLNQKQMLLLEQQIKYIREEFIDD